MSSTPRIDLAGRVCCLYPDATLKQQVQNQKAIKKDAAGVLNLSSITDENSSLQRLDGWLTTQTWNHPASPNARSPGSSKGHLSLGVETGGTTPLPAESPDHSPAHGAPHSGPLVPALALDGNAAPHRTDVSPKPDAQDSSISFSLPTSSPSSDTKKTTKIKSTPTQMSASRSLQSLSIYVQESARKSARVDRMGSIRSLWSFFQALCRTRGSLIPRTLPVSILSMGLAVMLMVLERLKVVPPEMMPILWHPIAVQMVAMILGWLAVLRCKMSVARYFEGLTEVQFFGSKWRDAYTQVSCFIRSSARNHRETKGAGADNIIDELRRSQKQLLHWFSLLHALAVNALQTEHAELDENTILSRIRCIAIPDPRQLGDSLASQTPASYVENPDSARKQIADEAYPSQGSSGSFDGEGGGGASSRRILKRRLLGSRTSVKALGTTFGEGALYNQKAPSIGSPTDHSHGLSELTVMGELTEEERIALEMAPSKVDLVHGWIIELISYSSLNSGILTEPPVLSRVYQELSNGMLGFGQAHKIERVQFPFPFAQLLTWLLTLWLFVCPMVIWVYTGGEVLTPWLALVIVLGYWVIQEIAIELENPFGKDSNHLPLASLHESWTGNLTEITTGKQPTVTSIIRQQRDDDLITPADDIPLHPSQVPIAQDADSETGSI